MSRTVKGLFVTSSQREVLECLDEYGPLTPRLLALIYGSVPGRHGRGYWYLQRQLRSLATFGLVNRVRPTRSLGVAGSEEYVVSLSSIGARVIRSQGQRRRSENYRLEHSNLTHAVAVSRLHVILALGQEGWRLVEFVRDERNERSGLKGGVCPDATAIIEVADERGRLRHVQVFFEVDLARKNNQRVRDRFVEYERVLERENEPTVALMVVPSEGELERLLEQAAKAGLADEPSFLIWNSADWYESDQAGHQILRRPRDIMAEASLATTRGEPCRLIDIRAIQPPSTGNFLR